MAVANAVLMEARHLARPLYLRYKVQGHGHQRREFPLRGQVHCEPDTRPGQGTFHPHPSSARALLTPPTQTLDCGSLQLKNHNQAKLFPGAEIATLEEVLDLVDCYGNARAQLNIETKLSPIRPNETLPVEKYITDLVPLLTRRNFISRATIQSFDWRTIVAIKKRFPCTRTVALMDDTTLVETEDGVSGYPWMGGMDLAAFDGDRVAAAASTGADVLSTVHGIPSSATVNTPGYVAFTDEKMVDAAHKVGMKVVPWTVDDEETIAKMISYGVDGIISN